MKNWFANNLLSAGVLITLFTAFFFYLGLAFESGFLNAYNLPHSFFEESTQSILLRGFQSFSKGGIVVISVVFVLLATVFTGSFFGDLIAFLIKDLKWIKWLGRKVQNVRSKQSGKEVYQPEKDPWLIGLIKSLVIISALICIFFGLSYSYSYSVALGVAEAKNRVQLFRDGKWLVDLYTKQKLSQKDVHNVGVIRCSKTHCAFWVHSKEGEIQIVPVDSILSINGKSKPDNSFIKEGLGPSSTPKDERLGHTSH